MGYIFISYSHKDKEYVHKLQEVLQKEGFEVWIDDRIDYGDKWPRVIQEKLDECSVFILVMSKNSFESYMVQNEVTRAHEKKKPVFTLLLDGDNWLIVQAVQYFDVIDGSLPTEKFFANLSQMATRNKLTTKTLLRTESTNVVFDVQELLSNAENLFNTGKFHQAIQLYRQVLRQDSENRQAKDQLVKAEIMQVQSKASIELPRIAIEYYHRGRSYIAAQDYSTATKLLNAAIKETEKHGVEYFEAKETLQYAKNSIEANRFIKRAVSAWKREQWQAALFLYNQAIILNPMIKKLKIETDFECTNSFRPSFLFRLSYNLVQAQAFLKFTASIDDDNTPLFEFVKDRLRLIRLYISFYAIIALLLCLLVLFDMNLLL